MRWSLDPAGLGQTAQLVLLTTPRAQQLTGNDVFPATGGFLALPNHLTVVVCLDALRHVFFH